MRHDIKNGCFDDAPSKRATREELVLKVSMDEVLEVVALRAQVLRPVSMIVQLPKQGGRGDKLPTGAKDRRTNELDER